MKKGFKVVIGSINAILNEAVNYDFGFDMLDCNLDSKEYFKRIIEAVSYNENIKKIIEDNGYDEALFYYELTMFMSSYDINKEGIDVLNQYIEIVSSDAKFSYLMFASEEVRSNRSFWINIIKQNSDLHSLKDVLFFVPADVKKDSYFQMLYASHAFNLGEEAYNIPSMYNDNALIIPTIAIEFIKAVYHGLEFKKEVYSSISKVKTDDFIYENRYGKYIRKRIDYLMMLADFRIGLIEISGDFIRLIPSEYVTCDMISRVREVICNKEFFEEADFSLLSYLDSISTNAIKESKKVIKKKQVVL